MITPSQIDSLLIALGVALVLAIAVFVINRMYKSRLKADKTIDQQKKVDQERFRTAVWASAVISAVRTETKDQEHIRVDLMLDVEAPDEVRYPAKTTWWVDPDYVHLLRPGEIVQIRIDRQDGMRIYPNVEWAEPIGWEES